MLHVLAVTMLLTFSSVLFKIWPKVNCWCQISSGFASVIITFVFCLVSDLTSFPICMDCTVLCNLMTWNSFWKWLGHCQLETIWPASNCFWTDMKAQDINWLQLPASSEQNNNKRQTWTKNKFFPLQWGWDWTNFNCQWMHITIHLLLGFWFHIICHLYGLTCVVQTCGLKLILKVFGSVPLRDNLTHSQLFPNTIKRNKTAKLNAAASTKFSFCNTTTTKGDNGQKTNLREFFPLQEGWDSKNFNCQWMRITIASPWSILYVTSKFIRQNAKHERRACKMNSLSKQIHHTTTICNHKTSSGSDAPLLKQGLKLICHVAFLQWELFLFASFLMNQKSAIQSSFSCLLPHWHMSWAMLMKEHETFWMF